MKSNIKFILLAILAVACVLCLALRLPFFSKRQTAQAAGLRGLEKPRTTTLTSAATQPPSSPSPSIGINTPPASGALGALAIWHPYIKRIAWYEHHVKLAQEAVATFRSGGKARFNFRLFDQTTRTLELKHEGTLPRDATGYSVYGSFEGHPGSIGVLSEYNGCSAGVAMIPNEGYFRFRVDSAGRGVVEEVGRVGYCDNCLFGSASTDDPQFHVALPPGAAVDNSVARLNAGPRTVIDLCVGVTTGAQNSITTSGIQTDLPSGNGGHMNFNTVGDAVSAAVAFANAVHNQSGSPVEFRVVRIVQGITEPSGISCSTVISQMNPFLPEYDQGRFAALSQASSESGADLTVLIRAGDGSATTGVGNRPTRDGSGKDLLSLGKSFSVVEFADLEVSLTHETAHNLGCGHDRAQDNTIPAGHVTLTSNAFGTVVRAPEDGGSGPRYCTIMSYAQAKGDCYIPYFSSPSLTLVALGGRVSLGGGVAACDNLASIKYSAPFVRSYGDGDTASTDLVKLFKKSHWARHEIDNCIELKIFVNDNDSAWVKAEKPATRGEMVTILRRAMEIANPSIFAGPPNFSQPPASYNPFPTDSEARSSDHWPNIRLFAYNGLAATNTFFYVNRTATLGEMVLFGAKAFKLGSTGSVTNAVDVYNYWRPRLRDAEFLRPRDPSMSFANAYDFSPILKQKTPVRWHNEKGILSLEFNTGEGDLQDSGYSIPARRAVFAKFMVNLLYYQSTPSSLRSL